MDEDDRQIQVPAQLVANVAVCVENLLTAKTLTAQGGAAVDLSNEMAQLITWHPDYDHEQGVILGTDF